MQADLVIISIKFCRKTDFQYDIYFGDTWPDLYCVKVRVYLMQIFVFKVI